MEYKSEMGSKALHLAARKGHLTTVQLLVNTFGADIEVKDGTDGGTLLHWATSKGYFTVVRILVIILGVDKDVKNNCGTLLHWAATKGENVAVRSSNTGRSIRSPD